MTRTLLFFVFVASSGVAHAQTSVQSSSGDGLYYVPENFVSFLTFKSDDTSLKGSLAYRNLQEDYGFGVDMTVRTTDGVSALVKNGTFRPGFKLNVSGLMTSVFVSPPKPGPQPPGITQEDWLTVQLSYERAEHAVFSATNPFDAQVTKNTFDGLGATVGYAREIEGAFSLGTSLGVRRKSNYDDLKSVDISNQRLFVDPTNGSTRLVQSDKSSAKEGVYATGNVVQWRNEAFFYPGAKPRVGFGGYHNSNFSDERLLRRTDLGLTLALLQTDSPSTSLAAVVFEFKDVTDAQDTNKSIKDRFVLSVQASVPIAPKFGW